MVQCAIDAIFGRSARRRRGRTVERKEGGGETLRMWSKRACAAALLLALFVPAPPAWSEKPDGKRDKRHAGIEELRRKVEERADKPKIESAPQKARPRPKPDLSKGTQPQEGSNLESGDKAAPEPAHDAKPAPMPRRRGGGGEGRTERQQDPVPVPKPEPVPAAPGTEKEGEPRTEPAVQPEPMVQPEPAIQPESAVRAEPMIPLGTESVGTKELPTMEKFENEPVAPAPSIPPAASAVPTAKDEVEKLSKSAKEGVGMPETSILRSYVPSVQGSPQWFEENAARGSEFRTCGYDYIDGKTVKGFPHEFEIVFPWRPAMAEPRGLLVLFSVKLGPYSNRLDGEYGEGHYPDITLADSRGRVLGPLGEYASGPSAPRDDDRPPYREFGPWGERLLPLYMAPDLRKVSARAVRDVQTLRLKVKVPREWWDRRVEKDVVWGVSVWSLSPLRHGVVLSSSACRQEQADRARRRAEHDERVEILRLAYDACWTHALNNDPAWKRYRNTDFFVDDVKFVEKALPVSRIMKGEYKLSPEPADMKTPRRLLRISGDGPKEINLTGDRLQ